LETFPLGLKVARVSTKRILPAKEKNTGSQSTPTVFRVHGLPGTFLIGTTLISENAGPE
jgi:hypothetical protein